MGEDDDSAEPSRKGPPKPPVDVEGEGVYKRHRIHVDQVRTGGWVAATYFGAQDSGVDRVKGEYSTRAEAVEAAKRHIDQKEGTDKA